MDSLKSVLACLGSLGFVLRAAAHEATSDVGGMAVTQVGFPLAMGFGACAGVCLVGLMFLLCRRRTKSVEKERRLQQDFSIRLIQSQEEERKRIAHELHDSLGQDLLLIKTSAELALGELNGDSKVCSRLNQIAALAAEAVHDVRVITGDLRPPELDRLGLAAAVEAMADKVSGNSTVDLEYEVGSLDRQVAKEDEINLYRMIQECLTNALKHAEANRIQIRARRINGDLNIHVEDDGRGFVPTAIPEPNGRTRMGMAGLAERIRSLQGRLQVDSAPGEGTRVMLKVPIRDDEREARS